MGRDSHGSAATLAGHVPSFNPPSTTSVETLQPRFERSQDLQARMAAIDGPDGALFHQCTDQRQEGSGFDGGKVRALLPAGLRKARPRPCPLRRARAGPRRFAYRSRQRLPRLWHRSPRTARPRWRSLRKASQSGATAFENLSNQDHSSVFSCAGARAMACRKPSKPGCGRGPRRPNWSSVRAMRRKFGRLEAAGGERMFQKRQERLRAKIRS